MTAADLEFWSRRYEEGHTPWDLGGPHPELRARLEADCLGRRRLGHGVRCLVPGCGRGHDALALARAGWRVTALDLVDVLGEARRRELEALGGRFLETDFLAYQAEPPYEAAWDHTFFCALPLERRPDWGRAMARLLGYRSRLHVLLFPVDRSLEAGGPPWRTTLEDVQEALGEAFRTLLHEPVAHPGAGRAWREEYAVFERLDTDPEPD